MRHSTRERRAKTVPKLTDLAVQALRPGLHFDEKTPSFGIRVGKNRKTWLVVKGANRTKVSIGQYPSISLQEARRKALVELGSPTLKAAAMTFPDALAVYLEQGRWRPSTRQVMKSTLKPFTWTKQLAKITHEDIAQALEAIEAPSMRFHAFKDLRTFLNWCVPRYLPSSPCVGIKMDAQPTRARMLTDEEIKVVWKAAEQTTGHYGIIVRLLLLTGQRRSEIGSLKWDYIKSDRITLPAEATKNGREHTFPIGTSVASIIREVRQSGSPVFPARTSKSLEATPFNGWSKSHAALLKASNTSGWTLHDLRRTFATNLAALNVPIHVTEKLLNHVSGSLSGVAGIYNRYSYEKEMRDAVELWEAHLLNLLAR
jgi:integrase